MFFTNALSIKHLHLSLTINLIFAKMNRNQKTYAGVLIVSREA